MMKTASEVLEQILLLLDGLMSVDEMEEVVELLDELAEVSYTAGQNNMLEAMNG